MPAQPNSYAGSSVYRVRSFFDGAERRLVLEELAADVKPNEPSFDIAVVQFNDDGSYVDPSQVLAAENCILSARTSAANRSGAMTVVFVHGWHHGADWNRTASTLPGDPDGDDHFHSFRLVLESLALREAERYAHDGTMIGRRVVGIYMSWNGDPEGSWLKSVPVITHATFLNRYAVAERIGDQPPFQESIRRIVNASKHPVLVPGEPGDTGRPESPLVMIGHSMGALMLLTACAALLEEQKHTLEPQYSQAPPGPVDLRAGETPVSSPDLILALNSAADSDIASRIVDAFRRRSITKSAAADGIEYSPPLLMSVTSTGDVDTSVWWPIGKLGRKTDGNDSRLFTHSCTLAGRSVQCQPRGSLDLGQNWHCLRRPEPLSVASPDISIDLPTRERNGVSDLAVSHDRYTISAISDKTQAHLMWVFQVPPDVIKNHNDIFNFKARSLLLALIQVSGAVASIAEDWARSFETSS